MKEKLYRFMQGRYGNDHLNRFLMVIALLFWLISMFTTPVLYIGGAALLILVYFRTFSRSIYKRAAENQKYLQYENKVKYRFRNFTGRVKQSKTHHIYACTSCRQKIRVPRGKGRIEITCPKCHHTFIKKS